MDSFLECAQKLEIEGLLGDTDDSHENPSEGNNLKYGQGENIRFKNNDHYEPDEEKSLARMEIEVNKIRLNTRAAKDSVKIDVGSLNTEDIDKRMRELYERTDEGWRCLVCDDTNKSQRSSNIRRHVETHLDGLVYTCNLCSKEFRSGNILNLHKRDTH